MTYSQVRAKLDRAEAALISLQNGKYKKTGSYASIQIAPHGIENLKE